MEQVNWVMAKAKFWKDMPAPGRPWPSEVEWFEKYIKEKKETGKTNVLILGATVEFRSLCHKYGMKVTLVDFSQEFVDIISQQPMAYKGPEKIHIQNWIEMDLGEQFDLVLGDWVPGVLNFKYYDQFWKNIIKHLKDDGLFIGREGLRPNRSILSLEEAVKEHYAKYSKEGNLYQSIGDYMYGYQAGADNMGNMPAAKEEFERINGLGIVTKEDYEFVKRATAVEGANASMMVQADFEKYIQKYFSIMALHYGREHTAQWHPIYVLKKK